MDSPDLTVQIAGRPVEALALPLIHMGPNHVAIGAVKLRVDVDQCLNVVVARRHVLQAVCGIAQNAVIHDYRAPRSELVDVYAKKRRLPIPRTASVNRLGVSFLCQGDEDPAGDGR
jgi:hypothetical protein